MDKPIFAVDVGGVLANKQHEGTPMPHSKEALDRLKEHFDLWVVSQCGTKRKLDTIVYLEQFKFPFPKNKQIYVDFKHTKTEQLNLLKASYFVDDRLKHVEPALKEVVSLKKVFHLGEREEKWLTLYKPYVYVSDWLEIEKILMKEIK